MSSTPPTDTFPTPQSQSIQSLSTVNQIAPPTTAITITTTTKSESDVEDDVSIQSDSPQVGQIEFSQHLSIHALSTIADLEIQESSQPHLRTGEDEKDEQKDDKQPEEEPVQLDDKASSLTRLVHDKEDLVRRLRTIFDLDENEELISSHPCWLFRNIVLQGYIYVLTNHLCFYAYMPSRQDKVLLSGDLRKKTRKTHRFSKHWAVLRARTLSWYETEFDPYFPQDQIDLRDVLEIVSLDNKTAEHPQFQIVTPYRTFLFEADRKDVWVEALKKAVFRAQNEGESVRISIPFEAILDIDGSNANPLAGHTSKAEHGKGIQDVAVVTIKVIQSQPGESEMTMDEYFFTNMANEAQFLDQVKQKLLHNEQSNSGQIKASMSGVGSSFGGSSLPKSIPGSIRRTGTLKGSMTPTLSTRSDATLETQLADASSEMAGTPPSTSLLSTSVTTLKASSSELSGYPPSPSSSVPPFDLSHSERRWVVPHWIREASGKLANNTSDSIQALTNRIPKKLVRETWSAQPTPSDELQKAEMSMETSDSELVASGEEDLSNSIHSAYSLLEADNAGEQEEDLKEQEIIDQFKSCFALPDDEELLHHTKANLYRILPVTGRFFISTNYVCFRSSAFSTKTIGRTLMVLPRTEIISVAKNNAVQYGRHGLVIIVRGHEELFFEFVSTQRRDQCISVIELQQPSIHHRFGQCENDEDDPSMTELFLTDASSSMGNLNSPGLFASTSSIAPAPVKPRDNLHFTFLTVGSRGDVQPYIALAQGLLREGHRVRIATHGEFGKWIESFGIEFREVGGDPAELMKICIENGTFTLAFVRESVTKFRGWLDDLLISCWGACQGTDVIIESPSAIAGIHIAEALRLPYYRAFTMPWTRTRAYPHAFAVPSRRAGGNYNYMSYVIFDQVFWRASAGQINQWRKRYLSLPPTNMDRLEQHKVPFLYNFSPSLVPKPLDWSDWIHVTGFWFLDNADETGNSQIWKPPKDLIDFIAKAKENQKKLVYIGWGSIVIADADAVLQTVVEAVRRSGVCAIISRGWSDRLQEPREGEDPKDDGDDVWNDIFTVQSVPHDWLFPQLDAACHHGGSGTLGASLRAGVPTIVRPFFGDQFFWASQVESLQIGLCVANPFTVETFSQALKVCTTDVRMKRNARSLADSIAKEEGVKDAIRCIYADWEYASSRIKNTPKLDADKAMSRSTSGLNRTSAKELVNQQINDDDEDEDDGARSMDEWSVVSGSEEGVADAI